MEDHETRVKSRLLKRSLKAAFKRATDTQEISHHSLSKDYEHTYSLEDVSIKYNEEDLPRRFPNDDTYRACRKMGWACNMRRRTYDSLNVLLACGFLKLNNKQHFELDPLFDPSYLQQLKDTKDSEEQLSISKIE